MQAIKRLFHTQRLPPAKQRRVDGHFARGTVGAQLNCSSHYTGEAIHEKEVDTASRQPKHTTLLIRRRDVYG